MTRGRLENDGERVGSARGMKITEKGESIVALLAMPEAADIDVELPRLNRKVYDAADFS